MNFMDGTKCKTCLGVLCGPWKKVFLEIWENIKNMKDMIWLRAIIGTFAKVGPDDEDNVEEADSDEDGGEEILSTARVVFPLDHSVSCSFPPICHWGMHSRKRNTLRWYFSDMRNPRLWKLYQCLHKIHLFRITLILILIRILFLIKNLHWMKRVQIGKTC